jgi:hypothetical protein
LYYFFFSLCILFNIILPSLRNNQNLSMISLCYQSKAHCSMPGNMSCLTWYSICVQVHDLIGSWRSASDGNKYPHLYISNIFVCVLLEITLYMYTSADQWKIQCVCIQLLHAFSLKSVQPKALGQATCWPEQSWITNSLVKQATVRKVQKYC